MPPDRPTDLTLHVRKLVAARSSPQDLLPADVAAICAAALTEAALACVVCADACLPLIETFRLETCARLTTLCADQCVSTLRSLLRVTPPPLLEQQLRATRDVVDRCAEECARHAPNHPFCRNAAASCHVALEACDAALAAIPAAQS